MSGATRNAWLTPDNAPTATRCRRIRIPDDETWIAAVSGALTPMIYAYNWEEFGTLTPEQAAERAQAMVLEYFQDDCMIGSIVSYATTNPPNGCIPCDGSTFDRVDYPALYDALDPVFIVDADTFTTPDLRGRTIIGAGDGVGLTERTVGETGGEETVVLTEAQLAAHTHTTQPHTHTTDDHTHTTIEHSHAYDPVVTVDLDLEDLGLPQGNAAQILPFITENTYGATVIVNSANVTVNEETATVDSTGDDEAHENMPPFFALKYAMVAK